MSDEELKALFHSLWSASMGGEYSKANWNKLQNELNRRKVTASPL